MLKRVLVPLDGPTLAEAVLPYVQELAKLAQAEIVFLRVAVNPAMEYSFSDPSIASRIVSDMEAEAKRYLDAITTRVEREGIPTSYLIREGSVAEAILAAADAMEADMIAMSTHGRSGLQRWVMGSIADRVVRHSPVPVYLIRPEH